MTAFFQSGLLQIAALILDLAAIVLPLIACFKKNLSSNKTKISAISFWLAAITIFLPALDMYHWATIKDGQAMIDCAPTYTMAELTVLLGSICTNIILHTRRR